MCVVEFGMPSHQVPKFHPRAVTMSARKSAISSIVLMPAIISLGSKYTSPKATAVPPARTPRKFMTAARATAGSGFIALE